MSVRRMRGAQVPSRPKSRPGRSRKSQRSQRLDRLTKPVKREFAVETLEVDTLRPLVDLAYWSTFLEVKRDAAAAFATLCMNEANLEVLSQAGALGALLALVGARSGKTDTQVLRDAASALSYLVTLDEIKFRLLKAPDGLDSIFYMTRSPNQEVKRAATETLENLCTIDTTQIAIVQRGGQRHIFLLLSSKDEKVKCRAAKVLKKLAQNDDNKLLMADAQSLQTTVNILLDPHLPDGVFKKDMMDFLLLLAVPVENKAKLVESGVLNALIFHLDLQTTSIQRVLHSLRCINLLAEHASNCNTMMHAGLLLHLKHVCFEQRVEISKENIAWSKSSSTAKNRHRKRVGAGRGEQQGGGKRRHVRISPLQELLRSSMHLLLALVRDERHRDAFLESGLLELLLDPTYARHSDKKVRRPVGKILVTLADCGGDASPRHMDMVAIGALQTILIFLTGDDMDLRMDATFALAHFAVSENIKVTICRTKILRPLIAMGDYSDEKVQESVARTLAELADKDENESLLVDAGALPLLVKLLAPSKKRKELRVEAARCISNLSSNASIKPKIVAAGALGFLISMSKTADGLAKILALATLSNLEHDTAALRIQTVIRGRLGRKRFEKKQQTKAKKRPRSALRPMPTATAESK